MDKNYYKAKLKDALVKGTIAREKVLEYAELAKRQGSLIGLITARIMELTPVSPSEAKTYIDYNTGKFKGGRGMPHCLDPKLKSLFAEMETICHKKNTQFNFRTTEEGVGISNNLLANSKRIILEMKEVLGDATAKEVYNIAKAEAIKETGIQF